MPKDLNGAQTGMAPQNNVNNPRPNNIRGRNVFPQSYKMLTTDRYGEYSPFYWAKCERGDVQNLKTDHDLHTFTLQSPMVSDLKMTKSFIKVPMQAIYPINWEKMFTIPTQGDDIPADNRALFDFSSLCHKLFLLIYSSVPVAAKIKSFVLLELLCSHGSLFERFNIHFNTRFSAIYDQVSLEDVSIDKVYDAIIWPEIIRLGQTCSLVKDGVSYFVKDVSNPTFGDFQPVVKLVSPRRYLEILRSNDFEFGPEWDDLDSGNFLDGFTLDLLSTFTTFDSESGEPLVDKFINIEPIIAYQLSCAQFGTNDYVDFIYSADLYRQNMLSFVTSSNGSSGDRSVPFFLYNGVWTQYDVFSQKILDLMISRLSIDNSNSYDSLDFFINLFSYVPSLRYGDYFTGGKPQPLAVGEYSAEVVNGNVSAVDITRSIQMQRLLNRVNMVGRKLGDYLAGIFGGKLPEAPKDVPVFLAHQYFTINGFETENTGERQFAEGPDNRNTITSHLRSSENRHSFEIEIDEPCYIIGMNSYESMRIYSKTIDRFAFHHDRYDDFIPEMQYIGDQDILLSELDSSLNIHEPFAYCLRYMEYKQRYSYASGGFIENLPSWAFITDNSDGNPASNFIDPDYIRSSPSEFDRFYKSLTGYSLGSYFHFIIAHTNFTEPVRMMEYNPEILK